MFGARFNDEVRFFISGQELSGVNDLNISYSNSPNVIKPLGTAEGLTVNGGPTNQKVSFSRYLIYDDIVDELRSGQSASGSVSHPAIDIPNQGSISLSCDNSTTNRIIGFDYSVTSLRKKHFTIGEKSASAIEFIPPLEYSAQVQVDVDDALLESGYNFLDERENKTVTFGIDGRDGNTLQTLTIPNASLVSESVTMSADGSLRLNLNYIGHGF